MIIHCSVCRTRDNYTNPMTKCSKCGVTLCYEHAITNLEPKGVIDYCEKCYNKIKNKYEEC